MPSDISFRLEAGQNGLEPDNENSSRVSTSSELTRLLLLRRSSRRLVHVLLHARLTVGFELLELRLLVRS